MWCVSSTYVNSLLTKWIETEHDRVFLKHFFDYCLPKLKKKKLKFSPVREIKE